MGDADLEIRLLLDAIYCKYQHDFRDYAMASLKRRLTQAVERLGTRTISGLQERVIHDPRGFAALLPYLTVPVSDMFRDPPYFRALRQHVVPVLRTYPSLKIWIAGCSTGEEVYSIAILLREEQLLERTLIYATDINESTLRRAREGIFPADLMQKFTQNYLLSGGRRSFSEYYTARYDFAILRPTLQRNIVFSQHNLVSDGPFNEFNVILCRNVMIYFNRALQERTHALLHASLGMFGLLGLGARESLRLMPQERFYEPLVQGERLFRRIQ